MKKLIGLGLGMVAFAVLAVGLPHQANGQSAGLVSSVLNRLEKNRADLKSLRANISMEKYDSLLRDSEKSYGVVAYVPGAGRNSNVRLEWNKPQHEILAVSNGQYTLFRPRLGEAYQGKVGGKGSPKGSGNILELLNLNRQQLQTRFEPFQDVREETIWGGVSTIHLKLVPKGVASYKYAEIWVDSSGMPVQSKVVEKNDDATTVRLSNPERNVKISDDIFSIKLDSNVKIIRG
jgi:Outer membrane lipoprotein carrier protein LolA